MKVKGILLGFVICLMLGLCVNFTGSQAKEVSVNRIKRQCGSERAARRSMKTISFKAWDISNGKKVTRIRKVTVHKEIANRIKKVFNAVYKGKEKFPIHEIGGFDWRGNSSSLHSQGLAVDINWTENYMIVGKKVLCGSFWKPGKNPYSIKNNGDLMRAMKKYGFKQCIFGSRRDYMHFSVNGR